MNRKIVVLLGAATLQSGSLAAQQSGGNVTEVHVTIPHQGPNTGQTVGTVNHGPHGGGGGGAPAPAPNPYPALTAANQAYDQKVAEYTQAYKDYQRALEEAKAIRDKYVDANNQVRPGWDYRSVVIVVRVADDKVQDALLEAQRKERERNEASSVVNDAFKQAMEQWSREQNAQREAAQQQQQEERRNSQSNPHAGGKGSSH